MFKNYMLVIDATWDRWPDTRKRAVLLPALATGGQRLFYALQIRATLPLRKRHLVLKVNVIVERHQFRQRPDEAVYEFLDALRQLAAACEFGDTEEQMLRDQMIERVANARIRDRLLLQSDLTLAKATTLALQIETGLRNAEVLSDNTATATEPVRAI